MRGLLTGVVLAAVLASLAACGSSKNEGAAGAQIQTNAKLYAIDQIEKTWHRAASTHDVDLMMTLWAPNATFTIGGKTAAGKAAIRKVLAAAGPFQPENHWVSDTPAYKIRTTVNGDKGTLYFECDYIDVATGLVKVIVSADQAVARVNGTWLITAAISATPGGLGG
jgi:hypothetical protein